MESEIKKILNLENVEVAHLRYKGNKKTYVVWTIIEDEPSSSSDDEITDSEVTVDIDIYSDSNYLEIMRLIKTKMRKMTGRGTEIVKNFMKKIQNYIIEHVHSRKEGI